MRILVINSGSSSIKYRLFDARDWRDLANGSLTRIGEADSRFQQDWLDPDGGPRQHLDQAPIADHHQGLTRMLAALTGTGVLGRLDELAAIGHRVVHGGERFQAPTPIDGEVLAGIQAMIPLAPLHNPANLEGIRVALDLFPGVPQVAVFDTAFHQTMAPQAFRYALPEDLYRSHGVRRYGFHGSSHAYVSRRSAEFLGLPPEQVNLISLHLGNGASATAVRSGRSVNTSMGMTPLEGLVMGTRCGDLDPAMPFFLCRELGYDLAAVEKLLNQRGGLLGLAGVNDMREIHRLAASGDAQAGLARDIFVHRLRKYLGAYWVELGRVDALVFTGGIGENDAWTRQQTCADLENLGLRLDPAANAAPDRRERRISSFESPVAVLVIPTNEEVEIARQTWSQVGPGD